MRYEAQKRTRIKKRFFGVTTYQDYWWDYSVNKWVHLNEAKGDRSNYFTGIRSVRAFRRRLKQWKKYLPKGVEFILSNRYRGHDVYAKI